MDRIEWSTELKTERERRRLTQKQVGMLLNCNSSLISRAECETVGSYTEAGYEYLLTRILA